MNVKEVKELIPLADVIELNNTSGYLIVCNNLPRETAMAFREVLQRANINVAIVSGIDVKVYDIGGEK